MSIHLLWKMASAPRIRSNAAFDSQSTGDKLLHFSYRILSLDRARLVSSMACRQVWQKVPVFFIKKRQYPAKWWKAGYLGLGGVDLFQLYELVCDVTVVAIAAVLVHGVKKVYEELAIVFTVTCAFLTLHVLCHRDEFQALSKLGGVGRRNAPPHSAEQIYPSNVP